MSPLDHHREEDPCLSPMTTLSSMNTIYATGSLFSNRPPGPLFFASRSRDIHRDPSCPLCSVSSFSLSLSLPFILQAISREMLPKHCKLIMALNIYYMMAGGLHGGDVGESGSVLGRGMWAHPQGHHYDLTLRQCHGGRLLHTCFTEEPFEN